MVATTKNKKKQEQQPAAQVQRQQKKLADFRKAYDKDFIIPNAIKKAIQSLGQGGWEYEIDFSRMAGVNLNDLGAYRERFDGYWLQVRRDGKRVWGGSKALISSMKRMV